jgi:hypothetical protein
VAKEPGEDPGRDCWVNEAGAVQLGGCYCCFRCLVPGCDNERNPRYFAPWVPEAVPPAEQDKEFGASIEYKPDQCHMYTPDRNVTNMTCPLGHFSGDTVKCDAWIYEDNEHTIVGEVRGPYIAS